MKKITGWILMLLAVLLCAAALADVEISEANFPDANFRQYIVDQRFDADGDGTLSDAEIAGVAGFSCQKMEISSLQGIKYFTALTALDCADNKLTSLDVSDMPALEWIYCQQNPLTELNVSGAKKLKELVAWGTQLTTVDVSGNPAMAQLDCSENPALIGLNCSGTQVENLNLSGNTALEWLWCFNTPITELDVSGVPALKELVCWSTGLKKLDVSPNTALRELDCSENDSLTELNCSGTQLEKLNIGGTPALEQVWCFSNKLKNLDVSGASALKELICWGNQLTKLDVSQNPALTKLDCSENKLAKLDVSQNTALKELNCDSNKLKALDTSKNTALTSLLADGNLLTKFDGTANKKLVCLGVHSNQLTSLTVNAAKLKELYCNYNKLKTLDVTKCGKLVTLVKTAKRVHTDFGYDTWTDKKNGLKLYVDSTVPVTAGSIVSDPTTVNPPKIGDTIQAGGMKYIVTGEKTISFAGLVKAKSLKTVTVPNTAVYGQTTYKVTEIADKALAKDTAVTEVSIGRNVTKIGKNAFASCVKLKTVTVKTTKLTADTVGAGAFTGVKKAVTFKCPSKKLKDYSTLFVQKGAPATAKFTK